MDSETILLDFKFVAFSVGILVLKILFVEEVAFNLVGDDFRLGVDDFVSNVFIDTVLLEIWLFEEVVFGKNVDSDAILLGINFVDVDVSSVCIILLEMLSVEEVVNRYVDDDFGIGTDDFDPNVLIDRVLLEI